MSVGNQPAFAQPNHLVDGPGGKDEASYWMTPTGMTYREWLIGQIAGGMAANGNITSGCTPDIADLTRAAIAQADHIIAKLDAEGGAE